ncbi:hypothetical protein AB0442_31895 [Kitasatospora sp. NPDC085895]|uniref:hypothetical protein n=1 Tax=Kitasatospora sp. NPDC085895 TaxID=3155057 RepID=UPI00344B6D42
MASSSPLLRVLRDADGRPALLAGGRTITAAELLTGNVPPGGLAAAMAEQIARQQDFPARENDPFEQRLRY